MGPQTIIREEYVNTNNNNNITCNISVDVVEQ